MEKLSRFKVTLILLFLLPGIAWAQYDERLPTPVARALKAANIPQSHVAVLVQEVGSPFLGTRVSVNPAQAMNPASVMKLVTTYAGLELLGPAFTWRTEAYVTGSLSEGVLSGDLYLKGKGDPKLTFEQFWLLLRELRARGAREIRGDLVLDRSYFEPADQDPGRFDQEPLRAYNVVPDALLLNFKTVRFLFASDAEKQVVTILAEPQLVQLDIINALKLGPGPCNDWRESVRTDISSHNGNSRLIFSGVYPAACGEKTTHVSVLNHLQYVHGVFRQLWQELGGTFSGGLREAAVPGDARLIASIDSPTLSEVVRDINKFSNNVMARQLFLTLGAVTSQRAAKAADSEAAIRAWLTQKNIDAPELVLENGSGLSRREHISANTLGNVLQAAFKSPLMPEFIASLSLVAVDGTLKKRLGERSVAGQAHIKTGSLEGVAAIAGYVLDRKGKYQIVVFIVNHPNAGAAQAVQDALLQWVYERGN